jgi:hypothetical protein
MWAGAKLIDVAMELLFDFSFFIHDMLAHDRIKFFDFHLLRHVFLVFGGGVEMAGAFA